MDREEWWLQFIGSQRLRTNWSNWACTHTEGVKGFELRGKSVWFRSKWEESSGVWARLGHSRCCRVVPFRDSGWTNRSCSSLVSFARIEKSFGNEWESISRTVIHVSPRWIYQLLSKGRASGRETWCPPTLGFSRTPRKGVMRNSMSYSACEDHGHLLPFSKVCSGFPQWSSVNGQTSAKWLSLVPFIVSTNCFRIF